MTLHSEMELLQNTREQLKQAIISKGQTIADTETMADWIPKIANIPSGKQESGTQYLLKEIVEGTVEKFSDSTLTILRSNCLQRCKELKEAKFTKLMKICPHAFDSCTKFYTLVLNTSKMVYLDNINAFQFTPIEQGVGKIYVPDNQLATYRNDEKWSKFYSQILPLTQYSSENAVIPFEYYTALDVTELPTKNIAKCCLYKMQTQECNLGNMIQFQATDTKALESFVIKKGTVWTVLIDNTSGWYSDSTETSLTTDYEFTKDITINIEQVYPLLNSYMFKDSGTTNYVILSAEPTDTIKDTDEILKFTSMSSADEYWNTLTHITLNKVEIGNNITSTEGWSDYINAFDSNANTYATCGTATDYLQVQYDLPVYIAGFNATCNFASGVARACNLSLSTYDTDTEVLIANGIGGAETETYTTSATFDDTYMRTLRFKLINTTAGTAPTTDYPTRVKEINLVVDPESKMRIKSISDGTNDIITHYEWKENKWCIVTNTNVTPEPTVHELTHQKLLLCCERKMESTNSYKQWYIRW